VASGTGLELLGSEDGGWEGVVARRVSGGPGRSPGAGLDLFSARRPILPIPLSIMYDLNTRRRQ